MRGHPAKGRSERHEHRTTMGIEKVARALVYLVSLAVRLGMPSHPTNLA